MEEMKWQDGWTSHCYNVDSESEARLLSETPLRPVSQTLGPVLRTCLHRHSALWTSFLDFLSSAPVPSSTCLPVNTGRPVTHVLKLQMTVHCGLGSASAPWHAEPLPWSQLSFPVFWLGIARPPFIHPSFLWDPFVEDTFFQNMLLNSLAFI